ncbi:hypothetical protein NECID01_0323 [Nematocida sp. AWRm77]|nr:hypothetical protein NECID01_0323 [Nematocida sp. AWRm77]
MDPDEIFEGTWSIEDAKDVPSEGFIIRAEECWRKAQAHVRKMEAEKERAKEGEGVLKEILQKMEEAKEDVLSIEKAAEDVEKEITNKKEALKILDDLVEKVCLSEETLSVLEEPWLESMEEVKKIEAALDSVEGALSITDARLLSAPPVKEGVQRAEAASKRFIKAARKYLIDLCKKMRKETPEVLHEKLSRYGEVIEYLQSKEELGPVVEAYTKSAVSAYKEFMAQKADAVVEVFKKGKEKGASSLASKVESSFVALFQLLYSFAASEAFFLHEVLLPGEKKEQSGVMEEVFKEAENVLTEAVHAVYSTGWRVAVVNLLSDKSTWNASSSGETEEEKKASPEVSAMAASQVDMIVFSVKKKLADIKAKFLSYVKKVISKEYGKDGTLDLDRVYFEVVDFCTVKEINTEVALLNIHHAAQMKSTSKKVFQVIKRACVLGAMHTHFLERKEYFDLSLDATFEEEMEKISRDILYLAEEKVFEKEKLSSIVKRAKEIMDVLSKVEGPLGFRLQIDFKDMVLSRADFHQQNEIAKILTSNDLPPQSGESTRPE